jgi:hypothetical protein
MMSTRWYVLPSDSPWMMVPVSYNILFGSIVEVLWTVSSPGTIYTEKFSRRNVDESQAPADCGDSATERS